MHVSRGRAGRWTAGAVATVVAASLVGLSPVQASPSTSAPTTLPGGGLVTASGTADSTAVTLITGDTVTFTPTSGGSGLPSIAVKPGPSGSDAFHVTPGPDGDMYVYPDDAMDELAAGTMDRELFNVTELVAQGFGDARTDQIPVIVSYSGGSAARASLSTQAEALPASEATLTMPSLGYAALKVDKTNAEQFWQSLAPTHGVAAQQVGKVWLDRKVYPTLDESVPLIGAPEAWEAGFDGSGTTVAVLDTGIDQEHPDVAERIVATKSFVPGETVIDNVGHGTHVASTIAGSGAESDGRFRGVAPGTDLVIGKVLGNDGGLWSWIIAGMEWAVAQNPDVINMSLGGPPTDGSDPISQAVDQLSAQSDTLFVVAAGNDGPGEFTVATPATADAALSVGAFDKQDEIYERSSRGPRLGDHALKPEIVGPGVAITAARAGGRGDNAYLGATGTSMAAPHVAGSAAILAQQHPNWTGEQIKAALVSTAEPADYTVYEQGAGRVDIGRATAQDVFGTGIADFRVASFPQTDTPMERTITYTNVGDTDVTLDLALQATPSADPFSLSTDTVTVPAGGQADVVLTVDPTAGDFGRYSGRVVATSGDVRVVTAVGYEREAPTFTVTVDVTDRFGDVPRGASVSIISKEGWEDFTDIRILRDSGRAQFEVPLGDYGIYGNFSTYDPKQRDQRMLYSFDLFAITDVHVEEDRAFMVDGTTAKDIEVNLVDERRPALPTQVTLRLFRHFDDHAFGGPAVVSDQRGNTYRMGAVPMAPAEEGRIQLVDLRTFREPALRFEVRRPDRFDLDVVVPRFTGRFDGRKHLEMVHVGRGTPEDYAGVDVEGKLVLVETNGTGAQNEAETALANGAAAMLVTPAGPAEVVAAVVNRGMPLPVAATPYDQGQRLLDLLDGGRVTVRLTGVREARYSYTTRNEWGTEGIPTDLSVDLHRSDFAAVRSRHHAEVPRVGGEILGVFTPWEGGTLRQVIELRQPSVRTDYFQAGPNLRQRHRVWTPLTIFGDRMLDGPTMNLRPRQHRSVEWFEAPNHHAGYTEEACNMCRSEERLLFAPRTVGDTNPRHAGDDPSATTVRAWRDGQPIDVGAGEPLLVPEPASYTIEFDSELDDEFVPDVTLGRHHRTEWTFRSEAPTEREIEGCEVEALPGAEECAAVPAIQLGYDLPLDMANSTDSWLFGFTVRTDRPVGYDGHERVDGMRVWTSYDDGAHWREALVLPWWDGDFRVLVLHPWRADGPVSLKVEVWDDSGSRTTQTIWRAYNLT